MSKRVNVSLNSFLVEYVEDTAEKNKVSSSSVMVSALIDFMKKNDLSIYEDYKDYLVSINKSL